MFVIQMPDGTFVQKDGSMNFFVRDIAQATKFSTRDAAIAAKPGHHRDMGGSGFKGRVLEFKD